MSRTLELIVEAVRVDSVSVSMFRDPEPRVVPGRMRVTFTNSRDTFEVDWTDRGEPPSVGSRWTLTEADQ